MTVKVTFPSLTISVGLTVTDCIIGLYASSLSTLTVRRPDMTAIAIKIAMMCFFIFSFITSYCHVYW